MEENILKKANQKRLLGDLAIEGGNFTTAYFKSVSAHQEFERIIVYFYLLKFTFSFLTFLRNVKLFFKKKFFYRVIILKYFKIMILLQV